MTEVPFTDIERHADAATKLPSFGINLTNVRNTVSNILSEWKSSGVFFEYTDHSFQHVIDMLKTAEWIIPIETRAIMTSGDWLMLTLSIYFHDIGLLVTKDEFEARDQNPDYISYRSNPVITTDKHKEYSARLDQLNAIESDRIQYQEFVRASHGKRVRAWVEGGSIDDNNSTASLRQITDDLLSPLDSTFRRDLAMVCQSHTLGHADAVASLKVSQPYGGPNESVNLQYVAIILRTVDLIQITNRRAPTVLFQIISPSNPTSQVEWQKQGVVRTVRAAPARDRDGNVTKEGVSSAIEIHATFREPNGFFGLTSYLSYARSELNDSYNLIQKSRKEVAESYNFPWRDLDDKGIDTDGFMTKSFEFSLDQRKILDLLTGHTLYNNSTVVLRELTQNALDAVRLQSAIDNTEPKAGLVQIHWDTLNRALTIMDFGTGMSQEIIESHLLTVGSSRYQDPKFKEKYPDFHSISRFGIGVLSAFMVSDDVEITTCNPDDDKARRIALRSVHGKYLIKLLDKVKDRDELPMYPHGTAVRLKLRPLAEIGNVLEVARSWLMFPRCRVTVQVDQAEQISIGFESPRQAIEKYIETLRGVQPKAEYKVEEFSKDGTTIAFALSKTELFQDWTFVTISKTRRAGGLEDVHLPVATCIEGVAIEPNSPGFHGQSIVAIANAVGSQAPKTNVARSALEDTAEQRRMLRAVYDLYGEHVSNEIARLANSKSYSLSRAVSFAPFIMSPLTGVSIPASKREILNESLANVPLILVESGDTRSNISLNTLKASSVFITIDSPLRRSIEYFVREAPADITASRLMTVLGNSGHQQPGQLVVCNMSSTYVDDHVRSAFEIARVDASLEARALTLTWKKREGNARWISSLKIFTELLKEDPQFFNQVAEFREISRARNGRHDPSSTLNVPLYDVEVLNLDLYGSFIANQERHLVPGTPLARYFADINADPSDSRLRNLTAVFVFLDLIRTSSPSWDRMNAEIFDRVSSAAIFAPFRGYLNKALLLSSVQMTNPSTFDSYAWDRREE